MKPISKEQKQQAAFNEASNLYNALKKLQTQTNGKIQILNEKYDWDGRVAIETNIPGLRGANEHLFIYVDNTGRHISDEYTSNEGADLKTCGVKNSFAVEKAVKYVIREAKANGIKF